MKTIREIRAEVYRKRPLIHCITNPISIHACANAILAVGAQPIMAEHPGEVRQITENADALVLNLGNITDVRMRSMGLSMEMAAEKRIPVVIDAVGVACSPLRLDFIRSLLEQGVPTVIKGNYSEILALYSGRCQAAGVDADPAMNAAAIFPAAAELAQRTGAVILASGKTDVVTDGRRMIRLYNGTPLLSRVTGTGCMLGALCGTYLTAASGLDAAAAACAVLGICGERADSNSGTGSFLVGLMDGLSTLGDRDLNAYLKMEAEDIETI